MRIIKLTKTYLPEISKELIVRVNVRYIIEYHLLIYNYNISVTEINIDGSWMKVKETPDEIDELIKESSYGRY